MQQCLARQGRLKSHLLLTQSEPRKCQTLGFEITISNKKMSEIRWAFNFTKWVPNHAQILSSTRCIQLEEKERLGKFVFKNDFKASLIGRLMMRKFISEATGLKYDEIKFVRDDKGRPLLENGKISFNVSHQGDYSIFGGSLNNIIGVDVVKIESPRGKTLDEYFRLMNRTFSQNEWAVIKNQATDGKKLEMFYRHWCLKESYLKAVGIGITVNLQDVSFKINSPNIETTTIFDTEVFFRCKKLPEWHFQENRLDDQHLVVVASNSYIENVNFKEIDFDELMKNSLPILDEDGAYCNKFFDKCEK